MTDGQDTITIPLAEYLSLQEQSTFLLYLRGAGVDNWDGYDYAIEAMENNEN